MKRLIINADDFGFSREVTDGIVHAHTHGCVTSTTLMANMPAWEYAVSQARACPSLSVGVHLTLTQGCPVLPPDRIPSLVNDSGRFKSYEEMIPLSWRFQLNQEEIEAELSAQIDRLLAGGLKLTHADSHHHITIYPQPFLAVLNVLKRYDIHRMRTHRCWHVPDVNARDRAAVRRLCLRRRLRDGPKQVYYTVCDAVIRVLRGVRTPRQRYGFYRVVSDHELGWNLDDWARYLRSIPHGTSELVCHPGFRHEVDEDPPDMREQRVRESKLLTNREALRMIRDSAVALVNFTTV